MKVMGIILFCLSLLAFIGGVFRNMNGLDGPEGSIVAGVFLFYGILLYGFGSINKSIQKLIMKD